MVVPKLVLVLKDKNEQNEYGVSLLKDHLSDNDFAAQYRVRMDTLEAENSQLRKQLRGGGSKRILSLSRGESMDKHVELVNMDDGMTEDKN